LSILLLLGIIIGCNPGNEAVVTIPNLIILVLKGMYGAVAIVPESLMGVIVDVIVILM
jgi:hypothetical protein